MKHTNNQDQNAMNYIWIDSKLPPPSYQLLSPNKSNYYIHSSTNSYANKHNHERHIPPFPSMSTSLPIPQIPPLPFIYNPPTLRLHNTCTDGKPIADVNMTPYIVQNSANYKCSECDKTFKHRTNLIIHRKIHSSSAYVCEFCSKKFARKTNLKQHLRVHTNERPFQCKYCIKKFKQHHSLMDHIRTHTGEKPFKCEWCPKKFAAKCNYIVHRRIHTGERPYKCEHCKKEYASKSGYNSHKKKYHST
eukprot:147887_1